MAASAAARVSAGSASGGASTTPTDIVTPEATSRGSSATALVARISAATASGSGVDGMITTNSSPP